MSSIACSVEYWRGARRPSPKKIASSETEVALTGRHGRRRADRARFWSRAPTGHRAELATAERVADVDELAGRQADDQAGGGRRGDPALDAALRAGDGPEKLREGDHAGRTLERLEPAHHLRLLRRQPIGREDLVGFVVRLVAEAVHPGGELGVSRLAVLRTREMRIGRRLTGRRAMPSRLRDGHLGEVAVELVLLIRSKNGTTSVPFPGQVPANPREQRPQAANCPEEVHANRRLVQPRERADLT